jgi:hypothetical protein
MKLLALLFSLLSVCSAEFYDIRYPIPAGYRVANAAEWKNLYDNLRLAFIQNPQVIPKYVRMAFHDVANFKADPTSTGGRGCILYDFYAKMSMNRGLTPTRNELLMNLERYWLQNKVSFGWGDAVQLAGKAAIEMAFPCISIAWSFGRTVCDGREKEGGPGPLIMSLAALNPFLTRYSMTVNEMAVLVSGTHGIAQAQNIFQDTGINSFTEAFINSGIDWIRATVTKPTPWTFFFTWFGLDLASFPFDPNFNPAHGDVPFITRGTLGRFNSDMMFFPAQIRRSVPVLFTVPNATVDPADNVPLQQVESKLNSYLTQSPSVWETDFINAYVKMVLLGTAGTPLTPLFASGILPQCGGPRRELGHLIAERQLVANTQFGIVAIPPNYVLSFSITPRGTTPSNSNILHFTGVFLYNSSFTIPWHHSILLTHPSLRQSTLTPEEHWQYLWKPILLD